MRVDVVILGIMPWRDLNEYEGEIEIAIGDLHLFARVVLPSARWAAYQPGKRVLAELWLERSGELEIVEDAAPAGLRHLQGLTYEAVGRIEQVDGEELRLQCGRALDVDLDLTDDRLTQWLPRLRVGRCVRVVGVMRLSLEID